MTWSVKLLPQAKRQIDEAMTWWAEHRSHEQATRWLVGIHSAIAKLADTALLHSIAPEAKNGRNVRQAPFGLGSKPTHRIVFVIEGNQVLVVAIRHVSQRALRPKDLEGP